ncbi:ribosome biogenesis protein BMS1 [Nematocida homosporus]|uniref:ribosome biogenesis protein BMS1 n=1 Tax=Nematocida homosporus TaxID=1912981 RepID=UPI00221F5A3F|nr:ribosome biogenesis protein BMS1 [Nematocida homosporus]KAI5184380.1 ribosome biogenesis protein BMS1 [Nematocida homosporus]
MTETTREVSKRTRTSEKHLSRFATMKKLKYEESKYQTPIPMRTYGIEPAPPLVVVFGPKDSGKSLLLSSVIRKYTRQKIDKITGIVSLMVGKAKRISLFECPADLVSMVDASKVADLVILTIDASVGLEIETFEMLNLLKTHGFPKITCVITKLDLIKDVSQQRALVKKIKKRMWTEICDGIKIFTMSKILGGRYLDREVSNLARFVAQMKYRPILWRSMHPYIVTDRFQLDEDLAVPSDSKDMRLFTLFGYVRGGVALKKTTTFHLPGIGNYSAESIEIMDDPCPLVTSQKKRLSERKKPLYAPMSDLRGMRVDQDAVYLQTTQAIAPPLPEYQLTPTSFSLFSNPQQALILDSPATENSADFKENLDLSNNQSGLSKDKTDGDRMSESEDEGEGDMSDFDDESNLDSERGEESNCDEENDSNVSESSDGLTEEAVRRMFKQKEVTEEDYINKFNEEYHEEEKDTRDIFTQEKDKVKEAVETSMALLASHTEDKRVHIEGVPPGKYVKLTILLPSDTMQAYRPTNLFILGANKEEELSLAFAQGRIKRHKWFKKTLKTKEAHYVSMGWQRFQTVPLFFNKDPIRNRLLKYIPDSATCHITFYGPVHPPGTGFCLLRKLGENKNFRIAANGLETEVGEQPKIMKKLKLVGYPHQIKNHTVFVKDMFHTIDEAAQYEGAMLKTVSGLRGQIKKAGENGVFRASFEGEIKMSEIIFLPCFVPLPCPKIYQNASIFANFQEIRLLKEIREAKGLSLPVAPNSEYTTVAEPVLKKPRPLPQWLLAQAPLSMLTLPNPTPSTDQPVTPQDIQLKALEAITAKARAIRQEKQDQRNARIAEILQERAETRKRKEDKMRDEAKTAQRQKSNKKHKPSKKAKAKK